MQWFLNQSNTMSNRNNLHVVSSVLLHQIVEEIETYPGCTALRATDLLSCLQMKIVGSQ